MWNFRGDISENYDGYNQDLLALKNRTQEMMTYKGPEKEEEQPPQEAEEEKEAPEQPEEPEQADDKENINTENIHDEPEDQKEIKPSDSKEEYLNYKETDIQQEEQFVQNEQEVVQEEGEQNFEQNQPENEEAPPLIPYSGDTIQENVIWVKEKGIYIYTSDNVIVVHNEDGTQRVLEDHHQGQNISALAISRDNTLLAS